MTGDRTPYRTFSEVFIPKVDKVVCFDRDLKVFILRVVTDVPEKEKSAGWPALSGVVSNGGTSPKEENDVKTNSFAASGVLR
jgi:hypothetical protein